MPPDQQALPIEPQPPTGQEALAAYIDALELVNDQIRPRSLVMALMIAGNPTDVEKLRHAYPWVWEELSRRRFATNGRLPGEEGIRLEETPEELRDGISSLGPGESMGPPILRTGAEDPADLPTRNGGFLGS